MDSGLLAVALMLGFTLAFVGALVFAVRRVKTSRVSETEDRIAVARVLHTRRKGFPIEVLNDIVHRSRQGDSSALTCLKWLSNPDTYDDAAQDILAMLNGQAQPSHEQITEAEQMISLTAFEMKYLKSRILEDIMTAEMGRRPNKAATFSREEAATISLQEMERRWANSQLDDFAEHIATNGTRLSDLETKKVINASKSKHLKAILAAREQGGIEKLFNER